MNEVAGPAIQEELVMASVYVLRSGRTNLFKIGFTTGDVLNRVRALNTGNPDPLSIFETIETEEAALCETYLHQILRTRKHFGQGGTEFYEIEEGELPAILEDAKKFLADYLQKKAEAERLEREEPENRVVVASEVARGAYRRILEIRESEDALKYEREVLEFQLKIAIGTASSMEGVATWKASVRSQFQAAKFKEANPQLYEQYSIQQRLRRFSLVAN